MNKMNLENLYIPASLAGLMNVALDSKMKGEGTYGGDVIVVSESLLVELFLRAGAVPEMDIEKMRKNELVSMLGYSEGLVSFDNQVFNISLPKQIIEVCKNDGENLVRAIMNYKNFNLKDVAARYGGKSGAANLANFMAKSNAELASVRDSTLRRLAEALDCPVDWLLFVREMVGAVDQHGEDRD